MLPSVKFTLDACSVVEQFSDPFEVLALFVVTIIGVGSSCLKHHGLCLVKSGMTSFWLQKQIMLVG